MKNVHHFGTKLVEIEPLCVKIQSISRLNQMLNQSTITFGSSRPFGLVFYKSHSKQNLVSILLKEMLYFETLLPQSKNSLPIWIPLGAERKYDRSIKEN